MSDDKQASETDEGWDEGGATSIDRNLLRRLNPPADDAAPEDKGQGERPEEPAPQTIAAEEQSTTEPSQQLALQDKPAVDTADRDTADRDDAGRDDAVSDEDNAPGTAVLAAGVGIDEAAAREDRAQSVGPAAVAAHEQGTAREGRVAAEPMSDRNDRRNDGRRADPLKATLDLVDMPMDDGWGGGASDASGTHSAIVSRADSKDSEAETGAQATLTPTQADALAKALDDEAAADDPDAPRLVCISGPDLGKEFVLHGRDIAIGRAPDNDVVLNDPSVSRLHCRILIDENIYVATDQRSGNGTIVNGRRIERHQLMSGNTLKLGQSLLRFVEMGDIIKSNDTEAHELESQQLKLQEQQRQSQVAKLAELQGQQEESQPMPLRPAGPSPKLIAALILTVAVVAGVAIVMASLRKPPEQSSNQAALQAFEEGELALRAKELDRAQERMRLAVTAEPDNARYSAGLAKIATERSKLEALSTATEAAKRGDVDAALAALDTADGTGFVTDFALAAEALRRAVSAQAKQTPTDTQAARSAAQQWLTRVSARFGDDADVVALKERLEQATAKPDKPTKPTTTTPPADKPNDKPKPDATATKPEPSEVKIQPKVLPGVAGKALELFISGRADDALALLGSGPLDDAATALKNKIVKFKEVMGDANAAAQAKRQDAEQLLKKALAFEAKIAQGRSQYAIDLKRALPDVLASSGGAALSAGHHLDAYKSFKEALALRGDHPQAKRGLAEVQAAARDAFNQGYIQKDADRASARDKWQRVLAMVPPEDELYQKAKKWLEQTK